MTLSERAVTLFRRLPRGGAPFRGRRPPPRQPRSKPPNRRQGSASPLRALDPGPATRRTPHLSRWRPRCVLPARVRVSRLRSSPRALWSPLTTRTGPCGGRQRAHPTAWGPQRRAGGSEGQPAGDAERGARSTPRKATWRPSCRPGYRGSVRTEASLRPSGDRSRASRRAGESTALRAGCGQTSSPRLASLASGTSQTNVSRPHAY